MKLRTTIKWIQIVPFIFGVIGSILIIKIMSRPTFRKMPRSLICIALAIVNLLFLVYVLITDLIDLITGLHPAVMHIISCKIHTPLLLYFNHLDALFIMTLTCERLLAIVAPFRVSQIITSFRTKIFLMVLIIFFFAWDVEMSTRFRLFEAEVQGTNITRSFCQLMVSYEGAMKIVIAKDYLAILFRSFVPLAIVIPANLIIIIKLFRQKQARSNMTNTTPQNGDQTMKTTWMIVWASLAFVMTTTPISVYLIYVVQDKVRLDRVTQATDPNIPILDLIFKIGPGLNFYIYFLSGGLFKKEMKNWLGLHK